jgi:hypothetical protein
VVDEAWITSEKDVLMSRSVLSDTRQTDSEADKPLRK